MDLRPPLLASSHSSSSRAPGRRYTRPWATCSMTRNVTPPAADTARRNSTSWAQRSSNGNRVGSLFCLASNATMRPPRITPTKSTVDFSRITLRPARVCNTFVGVATFCTTARPWCR